MTWSRAGSFPGPPSLDVACLDACRRVARLLNRGFEVLGCHAIALYANAVGGKVHVHLGVAVPFVQKVTVWKPFKFNELRLGQTALSLNLNAFQVSPLTPSLFSA